MLDNHETLREEPRKRHSDEILGTNGQVFLGERSRDFPGSGMETVSRMVLLILRDDVTACRREHR